MTARISRSISKSYSNAVENARTCVHYYRIRNEEDLFQDASLLEPLDYAQNEEVSNAGDGMVEKVDANGLPDEKILLLRITVKIIWKISARCSSRAEPQASYRWKRISYQFYPGSSQPAQLFTRSRGIFIVNGVETRRFWYGIPEPNVSMDGRTSTCL